MTPGADTNRACVLVSGGIESSVLVSDALSRYEEVTPIYVQNHLRWEEVEIFHLKKFLRNFRTDKLKGLKLLDFTMRDVYDRHWSLTGIKVPGAKSRDESVYLPGRNIIFLSKTACYAAVNGIHHIEIGVLKGNPFADSTKAFFDKMADVLSLGLSFEIKIHAPFQKLKKDVIIEMGKGLPLESTFSCINPKNFDHCGECNKCMERKKAFFAAGVFDKTKYAKSGL